MKIGVHGFRISGSTLGISSFWAAGMRSSALMLVPTWEMMMLARFSMRSRRFSYFCEARPKMAA